MPSNREFIKCSLSENFVAEISSAYFEKCEIKRREKIKRDNQGGEFIFFFPLSRDDIELIILENHFKPH